MVEWEIGLGRHVKLLKVFGAIEADECNQREQKTPSEWDQQLLLTRDVMSFANFPLCTKVCFVPLKWHQLVCMCMCVEVCEGVHMHTELSNPCCPSSGSSHCFKWDLLSVCYSLHRLDGWPARTKDIPVLPSSSGLHADTTVPSF